MANDQDRARAEQILRGCGHDCCDRVRDAVAEALAAERLAREQAEAAREHEHEWREHHAIWHRHFESMAKMSQSRVAVMRAALVALQRKDGHFDICPARNTHDETRALERACEAAQAALADAARRGSEEDKEIRRG